MDEAEELDRRSGACFRDQFAFPTLTGLGVSESQEEALYLCGNSLGLMPKATEKAVLDELAEWKEAGVYGHFRHKRAQPWSDIDTPLGPLLAPLLGAHASEVTVMNTLTSNLHAMLAVFYKPTATRYRILYEQHAFPSDDYAFQGQVKLHGHTVEDGLIALAPRAGEATLRTEDILGTIEQYGDSIAVVLLPGIQYYTGQLFDMAAITRVGHARGCVVGWDLAHAIGNVELQMHDWDVDFAVYCTYKYLNSGPGGIGGVFVHERHGYDGRPRLAGWWGAERATRFDMGHEFVASVGAEGFKMSNPSVLNVVCLRSSLELFEAAGGMTVLRRRSLSLTNYLCELLTRSKFYVEFGSKATKPVFTILTPAASSERGAQLSLLFITPPGHHNVMSRVHKYIEARGLIADERKPDVIRLAPCPLYNTHVDVYNAARIVEQAMETL